MPAEPTKADHESSVIDLTGIHHAGLPVANFERALEFYTKVLGLRQITAPKGFSERVRWLQLGEQHIHLILHDGTLAPNGPRHVALHVKDVRAAKEFLTSRGFELDAAPFVDGAERFYMNDPDGNSLELIQWFIDWGDGSHQ